MFKKVQISYCIGEEQQMKRFWILKCEDAEGCAPDRRARIVLDIGAESSRDEIQERMIDLGNLDRASLYVGEHPNPIRYSELLDIIRG